MGRSVLFSSYKIDLTRLDLFNVLFRVFDGLKLPEAVERREWMDTTCHHALFAVCDVFSYYYSTLAPLLLKDMHNHLVWCIKQRSPQLAQGACNCLENLVLANQVIFIALVRSNLHCR